MTLTHVAERRSGAVTTCFYELGLSRLGIEPRSPACEANALPLRHRGGFVSLMSDVYLYQPCIAASDVLSRPTLCHIREECFSSGGGYVTKFIS